MSANDTQVGGEHYKAGYQHWDLIAEFNAGYFPGQITKYLSRWRKKNGLQDLRKAKHFLEKYIEVSKATVDALQSKALQLAKSAELTFAETTIIFGTVCAGVPNVTILEGELVALDKLIEAESERLQEQMHANQKDDGNG